VDLAMVLTVTIKNGVVVLENGTILPEGTRVRIEPIKPVDLPTLEKMLADVIGKAKGLPPDLAENHDHYLHGRPKKKK
jgi:hypothetical protein